METSIKQRLIEFIGFKQISVRKFEINCGLSNGYVNNIRNSIQPEKVKSISLCFPELNTGWLMTGEGSMLKGNGDIVSTPIEQYNELATDTEKLLSIIASQQRTIEVLTEMLYNERKNK